LCLLLLIFISCTQPPRIYLKPKTDISEFKRIAVLPFDNLSGVEDAGEKMTEIFIVELLRTGSFSVSEPGRVKKAVMEKRIRTTRDLDIEDARWLGENLEVDLILVGSVLEFSVEESTNKKVPMVTVIARMVKADSGVTVWAAYQSRQGDDKESIFGWGRVASLSKLAHLVASEMLQFLQ
jgi:TolB-like protein